ncbi:MAG TPA: shikimate dehydrogenase [Allosphingosinicella sp.]|jgi:shikimate dehydrogenase
MGIPYAEVIGDPVAHSKSPLIHNFWLRRMNLVGDYRRTRVGAEALGDYLAERRGDPDWRGCNVTMPCKEAIAAHLDTVDPVARRIGAINTVVPRSAGLLMGTNTDFQGAHFALCDCAPAGSKAVLLGTGGAARAVLEELRQAGAAHVTILSRAEEKARRLLDSFGVDGAVGPIGGAPVADLLINATPLGMEGWPPLDLDLSGLRAGATVFDLVYHPIETPLLAEARRLRLRTIDGLAMLIEQAAMAFTYFFGEPPPDRYSPELRELLTR